MSFQSSMIQNQAKKATNLLPSVPNERLYFAGLKKSLNSDAVKSVSKNNITDDIVNFIISNPIPMGIGTAMTVLGLYYGIKPKPVLLKAPNQFDIYHDALKSVMGGVAGLIIGGGVIKYITQDSIEVETLNRDIKEALKAKKLSKRQELMQKHKKPLINMQKKTENHAIDMSKLFQN